MEVINEWVLLYRKALTDHDSLPDPHPGYVLATGATAMHIVASMARANDGHEKQLSDWLDRIGKDRVQAMGKQLDCSGRTTLGVALASDLNVSGGYCGGEFGGFLRALAERGVVGDQGEVASILLESMNQQGYQKGSRLSGTGALHLLPLHDVIAACSRHGVDWLVPLTTSSGVIEERDEALGVILEKLGAITMKPDLRAGLEALLLGELIKKVGKASVAGPRL